MQPAMQGGRSDVQYTHAGPLRRQCVDMYAAYFLSDGTVVALSIETFKFVANTEKGWYAIESKPRERA